MLYDRDRPDSLDTYIAIAIKIDDRQYARKQQHKGRAGPTQAYQANDKHRRHLPSTSYRYYRGPIDIDANQRDVRLRKDKTDVTCYNYSKKGHFKRECRGPKKDG